MKKYYILFTFLVSALLLNTANAQYSSKKVKSKYQTYTDSLKAYEYNYIFPIWGQGAYKKGFDIPYPAGIMANYMWMRQNVIMDNFQLGVTTDSADIPLTPVDFIKFGDNINTSYTANIRPDLWIFPFLNVYGIFGVGQSETEVNLVAPVALTTVVTQDITTTGFGVMTAFGIGPVWVSVDGNWTWNKPALLDKAVRVNVLGVRMGHTFTFKSKPDRNIALWVGGMRAKMESETTGKITLAEALPQEAWDRKDQIVMDYEDWYNNEATIAQKAIADKTLTPIVERIDAADGSTIVKYGMDKQVAEMWNMVVGAQFQLNKNWMLRSEGGVVGDRKSFLISLNYRFKI
jgi:hypothetical protein